MSTIALSKRVQALKPSATLVINNRAKALRAQGIDIVSFGLGEPDFDTPEHIRRAAIDALNSGQTHYMPTIGDPETRAVIAEKLKTENNIAGLTADHVAISAGVKHSLYNVCQALFDFPGQAGATADQPRELLLPVPAWLSYGPVAELAGGGVVPLETSPKSDFKITPDQLRAAITPRSRILMINSPSNPCGTMYSEAELRALAAVVAEKAATIAPQLVIVTDEIYEKIVYGSAKHFSIGSIPEVAERTITLNGLSKSFAMTGWRVGYAAAPGEFGLRLIKAIDTLQGQTTNNITSFVYAAIRKALRDGGPDIERMRAAFHARAQLIASLAAKIPGFNAPTPTGAFYLFPDVSAFYGKKTPTGRVINNSLDFADALLAEGHVATIPGGEFGGCGDKHIRLSYACSEELITKGMERIARFCAALK